VFENLGHGVGSIRTLCHPTPVDAPYPDDAPARCKKGTCECRVQARWYENGRTRKKNFGDKNAAKKYLTGKHSRKNVIEQRISKAKGKPPLFKDFAEDWIQRRIDEHEISPGTVRNYRSKLRWANQIIGHKPITRISEGDIEALVTYSKEVNPKTGKPRLAGSTFNGLMTYLIIPVFDQAIKDKWRDINPASGHLRDDNEIQKRYVPTTEEVHRIGAVIKPFWRLAVYLMAGCGLREGEVVGVTTDCVQGDKLVIYRQRSSEGTLYAPLKHRRPGESRWIPIDPILQSLLREHIETYGIVENGPLFPSPTDPTKMTPYTVNSFDRELSRAILRAGLGDKNLSAHNFRHYFATKAIAGGIQIAEIGRMLGHKDLNTTYKIYHHLVDDEVPRYQYTINAFLSQDLPDNVVLLGARQLAKTGDAKRIEELKAELASLTGMEVILRPRERVSIIGG